WDFGDGETSNSTDDELTHVYANPGVYNVCLTVADVNNPDCNDINCQLIFISGINPCQFELDILVDVDVISATVEDPNGNIPTQTDWYILESMTPIGTTSPVVYTFIETGVYTICVDLSVPGTTCMATLCEEITISNPDCAILECVFPGDADYNQVASNFDLLNLGLGFGAIGTDRVNASNDWFGQPSAAWNQSFQDGTNYKHADCNGDGIINFDDVLPIIQNYNRTHDFIQPTNFGDNPDIFLIFEIDTLNVTNDMIDLEINADIFVGTQNLPVNNLYGLAFTIAYPADLVQEGTAEGQYAGDQWFSPANTTLKLEVDDSDEGALDFAYSRTNLMNVSGFGQIATCKFVISDNLMGFNSVEEFLFNVSITDIMAVNALGQPILLDGQGDQVIILVDDTSTSTEEILENPIRIFPNPSSSVINIEWQDAKGQSIRMFNTLGKLVHEAELNDYRTSIQVANFASGIYLISIQTESGTLTRRVMVE
ncbi:MAG: T9SS type A sorting domain-containing protein, partial [Bacteroidota bacterium]